MKSIGELLNNFAKVNNIEDEIIFFRIKEIWKKQFNDIQTGNIKLVNFSNKTLFIFTEYPSWKKEICLRKDEIIRLLNTKLGTDYIDYINVEK
jgi:hypothetical protein